MLWRRRHDKRPLIIGWIVANRDSSCGQFCKQLRNGGRDLAIALHDHRPCKVFAERSRDNAPTSQGGRRCLSNLYDGPMPGQRRRTRSIGQRSAHDEMIVAANEDADHWISGLDARIGNCAADREVVDDLAREFVRILVKTRIVLVIAKVFRSRGRLFAGFGNHGNEL